VIVPKGSEDRLRSKLGIVIGPRRATSRCTTPKHIAGYCVVNDVSEREYQMERGGQWTKGKSCDTFCPIGPWLVTADEVPDAGKLQLWTEVNGERRQNSNTADLIFGIDHIVSYVSHFMTLYPGDVIPTGTPSGVAMGFKPPKFLKAGDQMRLSVEGLVWFGTSDQPGLAPTLNAHRRRFHKCGCTSHSATGQPMWIRANLQIRRDHRLLVCQ
jgi:2-keto-4-pentenoate hydratase/2-oxohepta-3-ene-1,7-dioic acid hydratase in catechol pathway